jgi:glycine dehydrogenase subunit 1
MYDGPFLYEIALRLDRPVAGVLEQLAERDILGGYDLSGDFPGLGNGLLVCATETKTSEDIARYVDAMREVFGA